MPKQSTFKKGTKPYKTLVKTKTGQARLRMKRKAYRKKKEAFLRKKGVYVTKKKERFSKKYQTFRSWLSSYRGKAKSNYYRNLVKKHQRHPSWSLNQLTGHGWKDYDETAQWQRRYWTGQSDYWYDYFLLFRLYYYVKPNTPPLTEEDIVYVTALGDMDIETIRGRKTLTEEIRTVNARMYATKPSMYIIGSLQAEDFRKNVYKYVMESIDEIKKKYEPDYIEVLKIFRHYRGMEIERDSKIKQAMI